MKRALQIFLPAAVLGVAGIIIWFLFASQPEPQRRSFQTPTAQVVARQLQRVDYEITLRSQGTVQARTESALIPEVRGRIVWTSPNFQDGAFFEEGETLLRIDDRDYQTELVIADAALATAELSLEQEKARYEQAQRDWDRLNPGGRATTLTLREPQLREAQAAVASARARVELASMNIERANVRAPFAGRVLSKSVDLGQYVSPGNELARVYAVDVAEARLPLTATQFAYLDLPAVYRGQDATYDDGPRVVLRNTVAGETHAWEGRIDRAEGSVDVRTRQIAVVARIDNPYGLTKAGRPPLKVGSFVEAEIQGKTLEGVFLVPRRLFRENSFVLVIDDEGYLRRANLTPIWENDQYIIVNEGLTEGDRLCLTHVPYALEGWPVVATLEGEKAETPVAGGRLKARLDGMLTAFGPQLPEDLRARLVALKSSSDDAQIGAALSEVDEWAASKGIPLPTNAARPRG